MIIRAHGRTFYMQEAYCRSWGCKWALFWFADALEFT